MLPLNNRITILGLCIVLPLLGGCQGSGGHVGVDWGDPEPSRESGPGADRMPPAHAPAHGHRAQQREYRYYPNAGVYFDSGRGIYFYYSKGQWQVSVELPRRYRVRLGDAVTVEADFDKPYRDYEKHRAKYPPGLMKKGPEHPGNRGRGYQEWED